MSAETHLAKYGVSLSEARDFIVSNIDDLGYIISTCQQFGVTNEMLAEIYGGVSSDDVVDYFSFHGFDSTSLDLTAVAKETNEENKDEDQKDSTPETAASNSLALQYYDDNVAGSQTLQNDLNLNQNSVDLFL